MYHFRMKSLTSSTWNINFSTSLFLFVYSRVTQRRERLWERDREFWIFRLLVHSSTGHRERERTRPKPVAPSESPCGWQGLRYLTHSSVALPAILAGCLLGSRAVRMRTGSNLTHCATMQAFLQLQPVTMLQGGDSIVKKDWSRAPNGTLRDLHPHRMHHWWRF